jgi:hypothetical protein
LEERSFAVDIRHSRVLYQAESEACIRDRRITHRRSTLANVAPLSCEENDSTLPAEDGKVTYVVIKMKTGSVAERARREGWKASSVRASYWQQKWL